MLPSLAHALVPSIQMLPRDSDPWLLRTHAESLCALPAVASSACESWWNSISSVTLISPAMQKCLTFCAVNLSSPAASLHAQQLVRHSLVYETSGVELIDVNWLTEAWREFEAWTPAPSPGRVAVHWQKERSGSETSKLSNAAASALIGLPQASISYWTWASFLLYPSFYLRVGSAKATAPSKAAITMMDVLILFWSNLRVKTQMSLIYDFDVTIFSNYRIDWFSKWVIPKSLNNFPNSPSYLLLLTKMGRFLPISGITTLSQTL
jgi:hypothetical protein